MTPVNRRPVVIAGRAHAAYTWDTEPGVVYLMRCEMSGVYKFGASIDPAVRLPLLMSVERVQRGRDLRFVWAIITNAAGRSERHWKQRWKKFRVGRAYEWVLLPSEEVSLFRTVAVFNWNDLPPVSPELRDALAGQPRIVQARPKS